jgi:hypothetical protein
MAEITQDELKAIQDLERTADDTEARKRAAIEQAQAKVAELQERIRNGESTGDAIKDFVIVRYGVREEIEEVYRCLQERLAAHTGEFILVVAKTEECGVHGSPGFIPRDEDYYIDETVYLGVINGEELILDSVKGCEIPTASYVPRRNMFRGNKVQKVEGNLSTHWNTDIGYHLDRPLEPRNPMYTLMPDTPQLRLEIRVGDEEVRFWAEQNKGYELAFFKQAGTMLGRPEEALSPQEIAKRQEQRDTINTTLDRLIIESRRNLSSLGAILRAHSGDDALDKSRSIRQRLAKIEGKMVALLSQAKELHMLDEDYPLVARLRKRFKEGA